MSYLIRFMILAVVLLLPGAAFAQAAGSWHGAPFDVDGGSGNCRTVTSGRACYLAFGTGTYSEASAASQPITIQTSHAKLCLNPDIASTGLVGGSIGSIDVAVNDVTVNGVAELADDGGTISIPSANDELCFTLVRGVYIVNYVISGAVQSALLIEGI